MQKYRKIFSQVEKIVYWSLGSRWPTMKKHYAIDKVKIRPSTK